MKNQVRIDCYLAVIERFRIENPAAHFEVVTATARSSLAPDWPLLNLAKSRRISFAEYLARLEKKLRASSRAQARLKELALVVREGTTMFLVCYEKNPAEKMEKQPNNCCIAPLDFEAWENCEYCHVDTKSGYILCNSPDGECNQLFDSEYGEDEPPEYF
nr:hypothetical protein [Candidatus Sigynarchaeota archaeon]